VARFVIRAGTFAPAGNKNAALPMLAAATLTDEPVTLRNVPSIRDVEVMIELLTGLGVSAEREGRTVRLCAAGLRRTRLNEALCRQVRSSILLAGPLAARHGRVVLFPPGGDIIGRRRLDTHRLGLSALGIEVEGGAHYIFRRRAFRAADMVLDEASVTATENTLMAAVLAPGETTIFNAACEPHVADLGVLLIAMGARIEGLGTNRLRVQGVSALHGAEHAIQPDHIEAASFLAAAAVTRGELILAGELDPTAATVIGRALARLGYAWEKKDAGWTLPARQRRRIMMDEHGIIPRIEDGPWPAFPSDLMSVFLVLATQSRGPVLFFEKMFESRMYFVDRLIDMGARIMPCDPHRVVVSGPARLHGTALSSPDIRAGMALILAALAARGTSTIGHAEIVDRGYEDLAGRLRALGAEIEREE
jgi:UDP-N-acetylglucosamine 1-carboxyvinyltransferase